MTAEEVGQRNPPTLAREVGSCRRYLLGGGLCHHAVFPTTAQASRVLPAPPSNNYTTMVEKVGTEAHCSQSGEEVDERNAV